jgi:hypothetical protein
MNAVTIRQSLVRVAGRVLLGGAASAGIWAALTWLTGGFTLHSHAVSLSAHDPVRPLLVAIVLSLAASAVLPRDELVHELRRLAGQRETGATRIALGAVVAVFIAALAWNTRASGGSDSSCYLLQAGAFSRGELLLRDSLATDILKSSPAKMFAPTGWTSSPVEPRAAVPICAPGLALVMAAAALVAGPGAITFVVPLFAAATVWLTYSFGRRLDTAMTGSAAAVLLSCSPIFLYQAVQPMSDVPATTLWMAALVAYARRTPAGDVSAGIASGLAVLTRPNLALIVAPLLLLPLMEQGDGITRASRARRILRFAVAAAPLIAVLAWLNLRRYGAPLASGYGETGLLFSMSHVWPNLMRYPRWLLATETPFILLALAAPFWAYRRGRPAAMWLSVVVLVSAALLLATYLAYVVFDDWWYTRFLLPVLPALLALSAAVMTALVSLVFPRRRAFVAGILCAALAGWYLHVASARQVFQLQTIESRFLTTGRYAARALPPRAVVLSVQQSGSIRYHGDRSTIAWDAIPPAGLDATVASLISANRAPFIALEDVEEPSFRQRFRGQRFGALDWPPMAEIHSAVRVRIYDVGQRDRHLGGGRWAVEYVR